MKQATTAALIQLLESMIITAIIAGIVAASSTLSDNGKINWTITGGAFGLAFLFSLAHSFAAYVKMLPAPNSVSMDQLGSVLDGFITKLQTNNAQKTPGPSPILLGTTAQTSQTPVVATPAQIFDTLPSISAVQPTK
jgi:hypothetical protein